jgi:hypothetical protein
MGSGRLVSPTDFPLDADPLTLCVAVHTFLVAAELWVVSGKENQTCENTSTKFLKKVRVAVIAVDLPVRRYWTQIDDARVSARRLVQYCYV